MIHTDDQFSRQIADKVGDIETRTDAEIVVVAASRSASYASVPLFAALAVTLVSATVMILSPWEVSPSSFLFELFAAAVATTWVTSRPPILRRLIPTATKRVQVRRAAAREFVDEAVHGTPNHTGVMVYLSVLEGQVEVLADLGIDGAVPRAKLAAAQQAFSHDDLDGFLHGLDALGRALAEHVPHVEGSDDTDLPNAPRIRL